jgi:hypothetical protein
MSYNPLKDAKFLTALLDVIISLVLFLGAKFAAPEALEIIQYVIGAIQPLALMLIVGFFQRDAAMVREARSLPFLAAPESDHP